MLQNHYHRKKKRYHQRKQVLNNVNRPNPGDDSFELDEKLLSISGNLRPKSRREKREEASQNLPFGTWPQAPPSAVVFLLLHHSLRWDVFFCPDSLRGPA